MSEEFDKEAEREKLRKKYEQDKKKREATEQMSELLLQGATMTNAHCSECGDPIFRYDGQEFCPTCEKPVDRGTSEETTADGDADDGEQIEVTTPSEEARVSFGQEESDSEPTAPADSPEQAGQSDPEKPTTGQEQPHQPPAETAPSRNEPAQPSRQSQPATPAPVNTGEASVEAARDALVQTLTRFSQQAAATEDPSRAQEHLEAAREAAEALAALRQ